jgi:thiamine-phosphate pyrophosphorylase
LPRLPASPFVYPILDLGALGPRSLEDAAAAMVAGGARLVQVRAKALSDADLLDAVRRALPVVRSAGGALIVNDRADVALVAGADGVHVGQEDLPPEECRRLLGERALVGCSTHDLEQLGRASREPVDYVAFGPVFETASKAAPDPVVGLQGLREARRRTALPLVAIGGITAARATEVVAAGADGVAVIGAVLHAPDLAQAVREMRAALGPLE